MATFAEHRLNDLAMALTGEASQEIEFDGETISAVVDDVEYEPDKHGYNAFNMERKALYMASADLPAVPVPGQQSTFDGFYWDVFSVLSQGAGLLKIEIERPRS